MARCLTATRIASECLTEQESLPSLAFSEVGSSTRCLVAFRQQADRRKVGGERNCAGRLVAVRQQADRHKVGGAKTRVDGSKLLCSGQAAGRPTQGRWGENAGGWQ